MMDQLSKLEELQKPVSDLTVAFRDTQITNDEDDAAAAEQALKIRGLKKQIEDRHALLVGPYKEITKALDAKKRAMVEPMDEFLDVIRKTRGRWAAHKLEQAMLEKRKIEAERQAELKRKNDEEAAALALGLIDAAPVLDFARKDEELSRQQAQVDRAAKTKGMRTITKFEVVTQAELPRQFLMPDESAIRKAIAAGARDIPGVRIWEESYVQIR